MGFSQLHKLRKAALDAFVSEVLADVIGNGNAPEPLDFRGVVDMSQMAPFATDIDFGQTDIACTLEEFVPGKAV